MKSPFPGMDPYLEARWGDVHARFMVYAADALAPQLPPNLVAHVEEYMSVESDDETERFASEVRVEELSPNGGAQATADGAAVALADPLLVPTTLPRRTLRSIRILDPDSGNRIVTAVEVLSRTNKVGRQGRAEYERKQRELLDAGASLVEIDLLRAGGHVLTVPYDNFPPDYREPYRVCVVRAWARHQGEIYRAGFRSPLPKVRIPLRPTDTDAVLDLQAILDQVYQKGRYDRLIDYSAEPTPRFDPADAAWADQLLRQQGKR
jgi:hypothetical protein